MRKVKRSVQVEGSRLLEGLWRIRQEARASDDGERCMVSPDPELKAKIKQELTALRAKEGSVMRSLVRASQPQALGFNDGTIVPPDEFPLGTAPSLIRRAAADRAPLRGVVRVIVVLVDFSDKTMTKTVNHFRDLFFSTGVLPTKSVREYYREVTNGLVDIQGDVVGPLRMPSTIATYAHGASGTGGSLPNAQTMARDAVIAADPTVNFAPFDNDGNGFVDAFIIVHAGSGAEQTGNPNDIWSHKWVLDGGARSVDGTKVYAYLTVPEDSKIGVCAHELGHLLFGFPDLYDTDMSSEGIGNWCLMAGGSWGGGGDTPCHPSAWCKVNQGWVGVDNRSSNGAVTIPDIKTSFTALRLWKDGAPGNEYFLVENRQKTGFDTSLPAGGLLIWHVDESVSGNTNESHYKVALLQADGLRQLENDVNRGDGGDPFPGSTNNTTFNNSSNPSSKSYAGLSTCVAISGISPSSAVMTANVAVKCKAKEKEVTKDLKDSRKDHKDKEQAKDQKDLHKEKELFKDRKDQIKEYFEKRIEKPLTDKAAGLDKGFSDKIVDGGKLTDGGGGFGFGFGSPGDPLAELSDRLAKVEAALAGQGGSVTGQQAPQPFIGSDLRPDLSQGALAGEEDVQQLREQMRQGSAEAKRLFDTKLKEG